ncbi:MAG: tripartite tricarboxylate transporter TctB family protein, partial [Betaproteobacteria bacterium]|nr:tripartite tricarboxylate transporter TctB family protein [Betaproteobacteria bacterium]
MQFKIRNQEDFWAGLMFIGFGILSIVVSRDYPMGSAMRMGPGYFPTYLGVF